MPEVRQEEMIEYMKQHLPAVLMTCEDPQGVSLWAKYGSMDLKTAGQWDFNKIPDDDARKQIWEYLYPLLMWEKEVPGVTQYDDELGSIRYVLHQKGWTWAGTDYAQGISFEKFLQGNTLIIIEYGTVDVVLRDLPTTDALPFATGGPELINVEEALRSVGWTLRKSTYSQGVVYANLEKGGYGIHLEMGSAEEVKGEGPGEEPVTQPYAVNPEPVTQHHMMDPETLFVLTTEDVRTMAQQIGIDPNKLTGVHYNLIKKGIESGLGSWAEVMSTAIREAIRVEPIR